MGNSRWDDDNWKSYRSTKTASSTSAQSTYTATAAQAAPYKPTAFKVRESKISTLNPNPTPIIVGLDQTGSMEAVIYAAFDGLGTLFKEIIERKPVSDPHIMANFIGDAITDNHPLQATQFEAGLVIADQLKELYHEGNGGGNGSESYHLPLYLAAYKTDCDAFTQGRKGFIFTIGDEGVPPPLTPAQIHRIFGSDEPASKNLSYKELFDIVSQNWHVFHLRVQQGYSYRKEQDKAWTDILGERALPLSDVTKIPEVIVATLQVVGGMDVQTVADTFSDSTAVVVRNAIQGLKTVNDVAGGIVGL